MTTVKRHRYAAAMTLVEVMGAILILSVAVIGASAYRYHSALDARKADETATATRIALLLCESWRGVEGDLTFDPGSHLSPELAIQPVGQPPPNPQGFNVLETYRITANGLISTSALLWQDIAPGLRALNVTVFWDWDPDGFGNPKRAKKSFTLTTYTSAGG